MGHKKILNFIKFCKKNMNLSCRMLVKFVKKFGHLTYRLLLTTTQSGLSTQRQSERTYLYIHDNTPCSTTHPMQMRSDIQAMNRMRLCIIRRVTSVNSIDVETVEIGIVSNVVGLCKKSRLQQLASGGDGCSLCVETKELY